MKKSVSTRLGNFESSLKRLEEIVENLEQGNIPLDQAMRMYEEGIQLSKECLKKLNQTEIKLKKLAKNLDGNFTLIDENIGDV